MSDWLQFVVDVHVAAKDAEHRAGLVRDRLVSEGWIVSSTDEDCVLRTKGHRPGPNVATWYERRKGEGDFLTLATNGVSIEAGPFTNLAAGPYDTDLLGCPTCKAAVDQDLLMACVGEWMSGEGEACVACGGCGQDNPLRSLRSSDEHESPVVCGNLTLTFFNWPPLEASTWKKSVLEVMAGALGARPSIAWTKL